MKKILFFSIILFCVSNLSAQKKIKLTKSNSNKVRIIKEGMRVAYTVFSDYRTIKGILKTVDKEFIVVDDKKIAIKDITSIGRKRSGSGFFQIVCAGAGVGLIIDAVSPTDNTPSCGGCQTTTSVDQGAVTAEILIGAALIALDVNSVLSNIPKDLSKWKLEIID